MGSHFIRSDRLSFFLCHPFRPSSLLPVTDVPDTLYSPRLCQRLCFLGGWTKTVFKPEVIILTLYMSDGNLNMVHVPTFSHLISFPSFDDHIVVEYFP